ncbi:MAG: hypothetical protein JWR26_3000 [Pedosphaera sp.]|nr:hypothetical protein [Pedosphaera sp.]
MLDENFLVLFHYDPKRSCRLLHAVIRKAPGSQARRFTDDQLQQEIP